MRVSINSLYPMRFITTIRIVLFIFFLVSFQVSAKTFDISGFANANQLIWDSSFKLYIDEYFGKHKKSYFWSNSLTSEQVKSGFGGPSDAVKVMDSSTYFVSACRQHSCPEKSAYVTDGEFDLFRRYFISLRTRHGAAEYCPEGQLVVFYKSNLDTEYLSPHVIKWKDYYAPKANIIYEKII